MLRTIPNLKILCPSDPNEVKKLLRDALKIGGPVYLRLGKKNEPLFKTRKRIGKSDIIIKGKTNAIISVGNMLKNAVEVNQELNKKRINSAVFDLRYIKPLDNTVLKKVFKEYKKIFVLEEHFISGGVGSLIMEWAKKNKLNSDKIVLCGAMNSFIHSSGNQTSARDIAGISVKKIVSKIINNQK